MNEWISVKDRLPEKGKLVIILENECDVSTGSRMFNDEENPWFFSGNTIEDNVTHWMPLPDG